MNYPNLSGAQIRKISVGVVAAILVLGYWPLKSVPTGSRGVITQFGAIKGVEQEGRRSSRLGSVCRFLASVLRRHQSRTLTAARPIPSQ